MKCKWPDSTGECQRGHWPPEDMCDECRPPLRIFNATLPSAGVMSVAPIPTLPAVVDAEVSELDGTETSGPVGLGPVEAPW
jgi:hypothetical protein